MASASASTKIRPPRHCHIFWNATRAQNFARILTGNPKRRATYDTNIRLLNTVYEEAVGGEDSDPRHFINKVNPLCFAWVALFPHQTTRRLLADSHQMLWLRMVRSKCAHCRDLADQVKV
jgi:hypothetical protein